MDLKWHSNISTDVALVKAAIQESTGFFRRTKNKNITKSNRSRRKTKSVKNFKPIYSFNISIKSDKHRCLLNLPNLYFKTLGRSDSLSKKDTKMDCRNNVVKAAENITQIKMVPSITEFYCKIGL